jgi:hypothetical protein
VVIWNTGEGSRNRYSIVSTELTQSKDAPLCHEGAKGERKYSSYSFFTSILDGVSGQLHASAALYLRERTHDTHWKEVGWAPTAGLDTEARGKILRLCRELNLGRPVCSQTLYWLSWPSSCIYISKAVPLHAMEALWGRRGIVPTHSWTWH